MTKAKPERNLGKSVDQSTECLECDDRWSNLLNESLSIVGASVSATPLFNRWCKKIFFDHCKLALVAQGCMSNSWTATLLDLGWLLASGQWAQWGPPEVSGYQLGAKQKVVSTTVMKGSLLRQDSVGWKDEGLNPKLAKKLHEVQS